MLSDGGEPRVATNRRERLDQLLDLIMEIGHVSVEDISAALGVSAATARRDLDALASQQLVIRSRGGASINSSASSLPLRYRAARNDRAKAAIARLAVDFAEPGSVIGLNGGTTATAVAHELASRPAFVDFGRDTVLVTNAINIAQELAVRQHLQLVVTGGVVRERSFELVGSWAEQLLAQIHIDVLFVGVNAVNVADGASTHNEAEASMSGRLIERATKVVLVADADKLGETAFAQICPISKVDVLITDSLADPDHVQELREAGVEVLVADLDDVV